VKLGIPRALYSFYHFPLWRRFLDELGVEILLSPPTDREIIDAGVRLSPPEICLPVKAYLGHVAWLRSRCDAVLLHRMVCVKEGRRVRFGCPKAMCLPDLVRATVPGLPQVIEVIQDERAMTIRETYTRMAREVTGRNGVAAALQRARLEQDRVDALLREGMPFTEIWNRKDRGRGTGDGKRADSAGLRSSVSGPLRIGVVGHPYLIFDRALGLSLTDKLEALGVNALYTTSALGQEGTGKGKGRGSSSTFSSTSTSSDAFPEPCRYREMHWFYETELLDGAWQFLSRNGHPHQVDGLLLVSSFACGTSAVINELIMREMAHPDIPVITIMLDEQTAEAGLATRLEAFVDMVKHRHDSRHS
jgi:predicted nucleotide-binding protein (sugar kinase/HSP70/actin superfamily)